MNRDKDDKTNNFAVDKSVTKNFDDLKILVIDDEIDSLDIITLVLEQEGATVTPVKSGYEALKVFEQLSFDLIISDIGMPKFDGYSLMNEIRKLPQGKTTPAIALSAYTGEVNQKNSLDAGFDRHINKPVNIFELITTINILMF